jgi:hypothetical protein
MVSILDNHPRSTRQDLAQDALIEGMIPHHVYADVETTLA